MTEYRFPLNLLLQAIQQNDGAEYVKVIIPTVSMGAVPSIGVGAGMPELMGEVHKPAGMALSGSFEIVQTRWNPETNSVEKLTR